ncbi:hypothetical protein J6590_092637 [Homalodisca vitripennis]|nr:hypothetical protein J6590_092637 [Homalodisca vitripennis]
MVCQARTVDLLSTPKSRSRQFYGVNLQSVYRPVTARCSIKSILNMDVNRTSARPMMPSAVSSHSLVFYPVQTECGCEQNICSTDDDLDSVQSQSSVLSCPNRTSARQMMTSTLSCHSLMFYHVQAECGCKQNFCSTDDYVDSVQTSARQMMTLAVPRKRILVYHVETVYADVNRTSTRLMMTSTVSCHSLMFYHVRAECGCEQNICSTDDDLDSVLSQPNVLPCPDGMRNTGLSCRDVYADVNRTSTRLMMTSTVSCHSLMFYHVQAECGCEQNIARQMMTLAVPRKRILVYHVETVYADVNRTSTRLMMTSSVSCHSLMFYHVQAECGCEQNIARQMMTLAVPCKRILVYHVETLGWKLDPRQYPVTIQCSIMSMRNADVNRTLFD